MRYIRFLKTPRIVCGEQSSTSHVSCLITVTSDLGDSFLGQDLTLSAELVDAQTDDVIVWKTVLWHGGRTLPISLPLSKSRSPRPVKVRVGVEPKSVYDEFCKLLDQDARGTVSAWSAPLDPNTPGSKAEKLVERRFQVGDREPVSIWEETGESIARHLWDAGITLSCHMSQLLSEDPCPLLTFSNKDTRPLHVVELGAGCGIVGITIARLRKTVKVMLTDLAEAREMAEYNSLRAGQGNVTFSELDWEANMEEPIRSSDTKIDLIIAADCTYNPDNSPALVNTIHRIAKISPAVTVAIAMKIRHPSEEVFFDLMHQFGFHTTYKINFPLPGDEEFGEETVYLYTFCYHGEVGTRTLSSQTD